MSENFTTEEENSFLSKPHQSDAYDVDLLLAYKQILAISHNKKIEDKNLGAKKRILDIVETLIRSYCQHCNLNFDLHLKHNRPIIIPEDSSSYDLYLAFLLIGFDPNKIKSLLDWQLQKYNGEEMFPVMVDLKTYSHVKNWSPFDNNYRLKIIAQWVDANRQFVRSGKSYYKKTSTEIVSKINWKNTENNLIQLSKELFGEGYIQYENSFVSAIKNQRPIKWIKEPVALAYLIFKLEEAGNITSPYRGHFKAAEKLFVYDLDGKVVNKSESHYLRKLSSDIMGRKFNDYNRIITKIDSILNRIFS